MSAGAAARTAADAAAITLATAVAFVFRAAVRDFDSLAPGHLVSLIGPALAFTIPLALLALWGAGLYGPRPPEGGPVAAVASALAWAAAVLAFVAVAWDQGPEAPVTVIAVGYPAAVAGVLSGRRLLGAGAKAAPR